MTFNVACDIDQVLCFHNIKDLAQGAFFLKKGAIMNTTTLQTHYIYPGAIEYIRLLCLTPGVRLTFYSAGQKNRNDELVHLILNQALPEPKYESIKSEVRVLSRDDLVQSTIDDLIDQCYDPINTKPSMYQKDLRKVLHQGDLIENAVLVDDQTRNAASGQVFNLLKVPVSEDREYDSLIEKAKMYDPVTGMRFLKCVMNIPGSIDLEEGLVQNGKRIFVYKNENNFEIKFIDFFDRVHKVEYSRQRCSDVFYALERLYERGLQGGEDLVEIDSPWLVEKICAYVSRFNGHSKKICRRANRICYVVGVLFTAIAYAKSGRSLVEGLALCQFTLNQEGRCWTPNFHQSQCYDGFYRLGLEMLKTVNPNYEFITPYNYRKYNQVNISDLKILHHAKNNEYERVLI